MKSVSSLFQVSMERLFALCTIIDTSCHCEYSRGECEQLLLVFEEQSTESFALAE
jgi:hypothetical protein